MALTSGFMAIHRSYYNKHPYPASSHFKYSIGRYEVLKSGEHRGCEAEFLLNLEDDLPGWLIKSWDDSWKLFIRPEFQLLLKKLAGLAKREKRPTDDQVFACLLKSGFRDLTSYTCLL